MNAYIIVEKSFGFVGKLVSLLAGAKFGSRIRRNWTHVALQFDDLIYSAEPKGIKKFPDNHYDNADCKFKKYVLTTLTDQQKVKMRVVAESLVDTKYSVPKYLIEFAKPACIILLILLPFMFLATWIFGGIHAAVTVLEVILGLIIIMFAGWQLLQKADKKTYDCAEYVAFVYKDFLYPVGDRPRDESPDSIHSKLETLKNFGLVKLITQKDRYESPVEVA